MRPRASASSGGSGSRAGSAWPCRSARSSSRSSSPRSCSLATGHDPLSTYRQLFDAAFIQNGSLDQTLIAATPLAFTGLAAAAAFRMKLYNIGAEGQMYMGAITGAAAGLYLGGRGGPSAFVIAAMVVAGCVGGAAWALIPGILRAFFRTNEILTSLLLNYVAGLPPHLPDLRERVVLAPDEGLQRDGLPDRQAAAVVGDLAGLDDPRPGRDRGAARRGPRGARRASSSGSSTRARGSASRRRCSATPSARPATPASASAGRSSR